MDTRLSLDTITIKGAALEEKFRLAAQAGFTGLELWGREVDGHPSAPKTINRLARRYGLVIEGMCPEPDLYRWHHQWDADLERDLEARLPLYAAIGAHYLVLPVLSEDGTLEDTAENLDRAARIAAKHGLRVGLEPIGHVRKLARVTDALEIVRQLGGNTGIVLDVFHFFRGGNDLEVLDELDPSLVRAVHLDDAQDIPREQLVGYRHRTYPGHGIFDVAGFCARLARIGYRGPYVIELLGDKVWAEEPGRVCATAYEAARRVLDRGA
ncbi:MAG: sugar phosphate isomerase/epimerase family protein [Alphaproteobacteria bacterium]